MVTRKIVDGDRIGEMRDLVRQVPIAGEVRRWAISVVAATQPDAGQAPPTVKRYVRYGCGPRGAQALVLWAKVRAVLDGRCHVSTDDLRRVCHAALRHRLILNFEGQGENVPVDTILDDVLKTGTQPG